MALGKNIKRLRESRGWDQKKLSKLSGVPVVTISALEVRDSKRSDKAVELARAFGISVEDLISSEYSGTDPNSADPAQAKPVATTDQPTLSKTLEAMRDQVANLPEPVRDVIGKLVASYITAPNTSAGDEVLRTIERLFPDDPKP